MKNTFSSPYSGDNTYGVDITHERQLRLPSPIQFARAYLSECAHGPYVHEHFKTDDCVVNAYKSKSKKGFKHDFEIHHQTINLVFNLGETVQTLQKVGKQYQPLSKVRAGHYYLNYTTIGDYQARFSPKQIHLLTITYRSKWYINTLPPFPQCNNLVKDLENRIEQNTKQIAVKIIPKVEELLDELFNYHSPIPRFVYNKINEIVAQIIVIYDEQVEEKLNSQLYRFKRHLDENYKDPSLTVTSARDKIGISESVLYREFKEEFDCSPKDYLEKLRSTPSPTESLF